MRMRIDENQRPLAAAFPEGFQPRPSQAGVIGASASIIIEAVSTAFLLVPGGLYAGQLLVGSSVRAGFLKMLFGP